MPLQESIANPQYLGSRAHDPRLKVRGPRTYVLGPWTPVQDSGKVVGKVLTVDLYGRFANLLI